MRPIVTTILRAAKQLFRNNIDDILPFQQVGQIGQSIRLNAAKRAVECIEQSFDRICDAIQRIGAHQSRCDRDLSGLCRIDLFAAGRIQRVDDLLILFAKLGYNIRALCQRRKILLRQGETKIGEILQQIFVELAVVKRKRTLPVTDDTIADFGYKGNTIVV